MRRTCSPFFATLLLSIAFGSARADTLWDVYQEVLASDPRVLAASADDDVAEARSRQQLAGLLPQVSAQASLTRNRRSFPELTTLDTSYYDGERYFIGLQQPLIDLARLRAYRASRSDVARSELEGEATRTQVTFDVVARYLDALVAADRLDLLKEFESLTDGQFRQVSALHAKQLAKITDVLELEARRDTIRADRIEAETELAGALERLSELTGRPLAGLLHLRHDRALPVMEQSPDAWVAQAEGANSELHALRQAQESARLLVDQKRAGWYPTLTLQAQGQDTDLGYEYSQQPRTESGVIGLNVVIPIYAGGAVAASLREAEAKSRLAGHDYEQALRRVRKDIKDAFQRCRGLEARIAATQTAMQSSAKSLQAMERGFSLGVQTLNDVLDARQTAYRARSEFSATLYSYLREWSRLHLLSGSPADPLVRQVSDLLDQPSAIRR